MKKYFKGKQYDYRITIEAVGLYFNFPLSYCDCSVIMKNTALKCIIQLSNSTKAFMSRLIREYRQPRTIITDKYAPSLKAVRTILGTF